MSTLCPHTINTLFTPCLHTLSTPYSRPVHQVRKDAIIRGLLSTLETTSITTDAGGAVISSTPLQVRSMLHYITLHNYITLHHITTLLYY